MRHQNMVGWVMGVGGLGLLGAPAMGQCFDPGSPIATYRVTFVADWSEQSHPAAFPNNPHFSPLIGGTHSANVSFWEPGGLATAGIERMAETGGTGPLRDEVQAAISAGTAASLVTGGGISLSPGQVVTTFDIVEAFPLVTLVTMIAPSPDWFVGVHGMSLRDEQGWIRSLEVDLWPYDAGTDSGPSYGSPNADTNPQEPIRNLTGEFPFEGSGRIGTLVFEAVDQGQFPDLAPPCGSLNFFDVSAYVAAFASGDASADVAAPFGELNFFDVAAYIAAYSAGLP
ncbi:MAG: spondin domain-containing protein [Planctomycetota bacterium]